MIPAYLLTLNTSETVNQQIYTVLRKSIINCFLLPGETISDKEIAKLFKVSRQPVRDAFIKLSSLGLIQILPQRGTFVMKISVRQVNNGRFIREAIETAIVRRASTQITDEQLQSLFNIIGQQKTASKNNDLSLFLTLDENFHSALAHSIDCVEAWDLLEGIKAHLDRVRYLSLDHVTPLPALIKQHEEIVLSLQSKDPDQSEAAMRRHLGEINLSFAPIAKRNPDWFDLQ